MEDRYRKQHRNVTEFDLYMIQCDKPKEFEMEDIDIIPEIAAIEYGEKLMITFVSHNNVDSLGDVRNIIHSGLPLNVWIKEDDTLQGVIDGYLGQARDYILGTYRVNLKNDRLITITKRRRNKYMPYEEFIEDYPNDFIVIVFNEQLELLTFPQKVHHQF